MDTNNPVEMKKYFDARLAEMPADLLRRAVQVIIDFVPVEAKRMIREDFFRFGEHNWIHDGRLGHHGGGRQIRNLFRQHGITDDQLPHECWDDYYVQVVEVALDLRPWPRPPLPDTLTNFAIPHKPSRLDRVVNWLVTKIRAA
jgi:hypothetical protein